MLRTQSPRKIRSASGTTVQSFSVEFNLTTEPRRESPASRNAQMPYASVDIGPGLSAVSTISPDPSDGSRVKSRLQVSAPAWEDLDDAEDGGSITRQLAETATGVREMSKQLGRTKVKSNIQHVLIVTKARDNALIKLTREVAVYLMSKKNGNNGRSNGRGMVVYVDSQLRSSKRFNAAGLEKEHPEFFKPLPRRRSSSSASIHTLSTSLSDVSLLSRASSIGGAKRRSDNGRDADNDQGQLRYWTADMCSNTPNLFDFVVTVSQPTSAKTYEFLRSAFTARRRRHRFVHFMALPKDRSTRPALRSRIPRLLDQL
jgi:NAD+ kinase